MSIYNFLVHLFIPHYSNNQKPKLLHPSTLLVFAFILSFLQVLLHFLPKAGVRVLGYAANISVDEVLRLTNQKRQEAGLPPLKLDPVLNQAAKNKGEDMLAKDYWAHVSPDGVEPWKFFLDAGYKYRYAGENLARDFSNAASAVDAWMASPSHRENLLSPKYEDVGLAVVEGDLGGVDTTIIVQLFGTRLAGSGEVSPVAKKEERTLLSAKAKVQEQEIKPTPIPDEYKKSEIELSPIPVFEVGKPVVLEAGSALGENNFATPIPAFLISPFGLFKNLSLYLTLVLILVFTIDAIIVSRKNITRVSGRSFAHISFLGMILAVILILRAGKIL